LGRHDFQGICDLDQLHAFAPADRLVGLGIPDLAVDENPSGGSCEF